MSPKLRITEKSNAVKTLSVTAADVRLATALDSACSFNSYSVRFAFHYSEPHLTGYTVDVNNSNDTYDGKTINIA